MDGIKPIIYLILSLTVLNLILTGWLLFTVLRFYWVYCDATMSEHSPGE